MKRKDKYAKIVVYVPASHSGAIREALNLFSGSKLGKYDYCSFSTKGTGRFRPLAGSNPYVGKQGRLQRMEEEKIETTVLQRDLLKLIKTIKKVHPYEEPAIDVYPLLYP